MIKTGADGYAKFQVSDGSTFEVFPNSEVVFRKTYGIGDLLNVWMGKVKVYIQHLPGIPNPNNVTTPTALISVRGTIFDVDVQDLEGTTFVTLDEGAVDVRHLRVASGVVRLNPGESIQVLPNMPLVPLAHDRGLILRQVLRGLEDAVRQVIYQRRTAGTPGGTTGPVGTSGGAQGDKGKNTGTGTGTGAPTGAPPLRPRLLLRAAATSFVPRSTYIPAAPFSGAACSHARDKLKECALVLLGAVRCVQAQSSNPPAAGLEPAWDIAVVLREMSANAGRLLPVLNQLDAHAWVAKGASDTFVHQLESSRQQARAIADEAKALAAIPRNSPARLQLFFRMEGLETMVASLQEGARKYQGPQTAQSLAALYGEGGVNRERFRSYIVNLAAEREHQFEVMDREAQRCRATLMAAPAAPQDKEGRSKPPCRSPAISVERNPPEFAPVAPRTPAITISAKNA